MLPVCDVLQCNSGLPNFFDMHVLASHYRSEFLACPQLVRFDFAMGNNDFEPTLLIKGSTLLLKYLVMGVRMKLAFARFNDRLLYGLKIYDDPEKAGLLWSVLEREEEKSALVALAGGDCCQTFLFNEIAVNVAWSAIEINFAEADLLGLVQGAATGSIDYNDLKGRASALLDRFHGATKSDADLVVADIPGTTNWRHLRNVLITNRASSSLIDLFETNEGNQQEQIGIWLTDNLHLREVYHSPQVPHGRQTRELTDILLSYENGSFLIESKALSIFARDTLPDRAKLISDVSKRVTQAVSQLRGGIRNLKSGVTITTPEGDPVEVERAKPMHEIVLIPDLDLIGDPKTYGVEFIRDFAKSTGGFLHLLDTAELLRMVQAAEMIAARANKITPMMAFDFYLMERFKKALEAGTLCFEMLLRFVD